jgi:uncharacterized repeat protein (TIGR03803 family)
MAASRTSQTGEMTEPLSGRKPVLALLMRRLWAAALVLPVFSAQAGVVLTTLHSFQPFPNGKNPSAGLVRGSDGNFYGTAPGGGTRDSGTVFKISTNGALTSLYSFTGGNDGGGPNGLVQDSDGYFYGTTGGGGTRDSGTVFKISTNGALTSLYSFTGGYDGWWPQAGLVQGSDGYFYGTTQNGGTNNSGTVFKISTKGALTSLYSFTGTDDGANPYAGLVQGSDGYFYGTTSGGGTGYSGTVFKISTNGALTSLYSFTGGNDGALPYAGLAQGSDGYFYGTTQNGGTNNVGTVFKISTNGALTSLYSFTGGYDGGWPQAGLVQGSDGYFYGTTQYGGNNSGTVFKISTKGALTSLYSFTGGNDGANPYAGLVQGSDGYFYGTTSGGGNTNFNYGSGDGTVFKISTNGALTSLYSFTGGYDGANPYAGLVQGSDGYFYGTTAYSGTNVYGTVFKISTNGALTSLYSFTGGNDGNYPNGLVQGSDGYFYGTTEGGGANSAGTVFKVSVNGALTSLYSFTGGKDGANPESGLVQGSDGYFYGTTIGGGNTNFNYGSGDGTVFKVSVNGALTSLYSFTGGNDGAIPWAGLVQGSDGYFYGMTGAGTTNGSGTVFKISTNGALTSLYSFTGTNDGTFPYAGLVQGSDGYFYGTTPSGGTNNEGTVFRLTVVWAAPVFLTVTLTNGTLSLTWSTEAGGTYQLQCNSDLSSSNWTNLGSAFIATGATLSTTDSVTNGPRRFYRVVH